MTGRARRPAGWWATIADLRQRRWLRWSLDLGLAVAVVAVIGAWQTRGHVASGTVLSGVTLRSLDGGTSRLSPFRGKPTALAFWAPWCSVCKAESGNLSWLAKLGADGGDVFHQLQQLARSPEERLRMGLAHGRNRPRVAE